MKYKVGDRFLYSTWYTVVEVNNYRGNVYYDLKRDGGGNRIIPEVPEGSLDAAAEIDIASECEYFKTIEKHYAI